MGGAECQWFALNFGRFHEYTMFGLLNCTKVKLPLTSRPRRVIL